jgi:hypothetical protein
VKYEKQFETDVHITVQRLFQDHDILPPAVLHRTVEKSVDARPYGSAKKAVRAN